MMRLSKNIFLSLGLIFLAGCASGPFSSYNRELREVRSRASYGDLAGASKKLESHRGGLNSQLFFLENGRLNLALRNSSASKKDFAEAIKSFIEEENEAEYDVTNGLSKASSLLLNDLIIPYSAEPYERIFVHNYQALNYLLEGDISGAGVEIRRGLYAQRKEELKYEKELWDSIKEQEKSDYPTVSKRTIEDTFARKYIVMDRVADLVNSSFVNPYLYFLSGLVQELDGDFSNAFVSYRKAINAAPKNKAVQNVLMNMAAKVDPALLRNYENKFGRKFVELKEKFEGELIVLYEDGFVPMKEEVSIPFPTGYGITTVAFPIYNEAKKYSSPLSISGTGGEVLGQTQILCNVQAMAYKALKEKLALTATKTVIRVAGKVILQRQAAKEFGEWGEFFSTIWNVVSERADTRSWTTLPANIQVFQTRLKAGKHELFFNRVKSESVEIKEGRKTLVLINNLGSYSTIQVVNL